MINKMIPIKNGWNICLSMLLGLGLLAGLFCLTFFFDNKYQTPPPYGSAGVISLDAGDLTRELPVFLIDGWLLTDSRATKLPTYIGQYGNLQRGDRSATPHGAADYELTLRYDGPDMEVSLYFPQLFSRHRITVDDTVLSEGTGGTSATFHLTRGDHLLRVETFSVRGYYSGMYHPPALGTVESVSRMVLIQCTSYSLLFFAPLVLSMFTLTLWRSVTDKAALWFGLLCCCFSLYVSYYFVRLFGWSFGEWWHLIQSAALYGLCFCAIRLTALFSKEPKPSAILQWISGILSLILLGLAMSVPVFPWAVQLHAVLTDLFFLYTFCALIVINLRGVKSASREVAFSRLSCGIFGVGLIYNLLTSPALDKVFLAQNLFEPIRFFWQFEWCGILLTASFGATMIARNSRILAENQNFQEHLEELVQKRTEELTDLMQERKAFFADMAHDLKAPLFATASFIQAIREHNTGVDAELSGYLDLVEQSQQEMARRVRGLSEINQVDELSEPFRRISVQQLLEETWQLHRPTAEVQSVHFTVTLPENDGMLYAQPRKLDIMLENLIFNALNATPPEGSISLSARLDEKVCRLILSDTGRGIPQEELPHIFDRFYVGKAQEGSGSGLGLYIVKCIVDGLHGDIHVSSIPEMGTEFSIDLPMMQTSRS